MSKFYGLSFLFYCRKQRDRLSNGVHHQNTVLSTTSETGEKLNIKSNITSNFGFTKFYLQQVEVI